jgi:hypothetical protein
LKDKLGVCFDFSNSQIPLLAPSQQLSLGRSGNSDDLHEVARILGAEIFPLQAWPNPSPDLHLTESVAYEFRWLEGD